MAYKRISKESQAPDRMYRFNAPAKPHDRVIVLKAGDELEGKFVDISVRGDFTDYLFEDKDGKIFSVPKTKAIVDSLAEVAKGSQIKLVYEGKKKLKGGKTFHQIEIYLDDAVPMSSESEDDGEPL